MKSCIKRHNFSLRFTAFSLSLLLAFSNASVYPAPIPAQAPTEKPHPATSFLIPEAFAKIDESFRGKSDKTIIYIQDAHDSLEAQENIAQTIQYLVEHNGVKTVYEEGYEGPV